MLDFKKEIAIKLAKATEKKIQEIQKNIEKPKDDKNGDYAFPCFFLAKELKKAPQEIAKEIKEKIEIDTNIIEEIKIVGPYLNFYINKETLVYFN